MDVKFNAYRGWGHYSHFSQTGKVVKQLLELLTPEFNWDNIYSWYFDLRTCRLFNDLII